MHLPNSLIDVYGKQIGPYGIAVYCCLALQVDAHGQADPSIPFVAQRLGISTRQTIRALRHLCNAGLVCITKGKQRNVYQLPLHSDSQSPVTHSHYYSDSQSPVTHSHYPSFTGNGSQIPPLVPPVLDSSPVPDPKILLDPKKKPKTARARTGERRIVPTDLDGFNRWWASYTPSRCMEKPACLLLWIKEGLEARVDEIMAHTQAMQQTQQWQDEEKIPHTTTYLRKKRYATPPPRSAPLAGDFTLEQALAEDAAWRASL